MKSLEKIFIPKVIQPQDIDGIPLEVFSYKRDFGGKSWNQVQQGIYYTHTDVFNLMDYTTLVHFIAGYLKIIIDDPFDDLAFVMCSFASKKGFIEFCKLLSEEQVVKISETLEVCIRSDDCLTESIVTSMRDNVNIILKEKKRNPME